MAQLPERDVQDLAELERLRGFVLSELPGVGAVSTTTSITISNDLRVLSGKLTRTRASRFEVSDGSNTQITVSFRFSIRDVEILEVFRELVFCSTLTDLTVRFPVELENGRERNSMRLFDFLVLRTVHALRGSRSLSTLDITLSIIPAHVNGITGCFSGNSALRKCTVRLYPCDPESPPGRHPHRRHPLQKILEYFTTTEENEANVGLKELVLKSTQESSFCGCVQCEDAIVDVVARNTTLEKLEVGEHIIPKRDHNFLGTAMASALGCNRTLTELGFPCPVVALKELVRVLVPGADGRQPNTTLCTLKLSLTNCESVLTDCVTDLVTLVGSNSTLKHVQVSHERRCAVFTNSDYQRAMAMESRLRDELKRMVRNELRRNASLESLSVGWWNLRRVGSGHVWQMTYEGPFLEQRTYCLAEHSVKAEYVVKVQMR